MTTLSANGAEKTLGVQSPNISDIDLGRLRAGKRVAINATPEFTQKVEKANIFDEKMTPKTWRSRLAEIRYIFQPKKKFADEKALDHDKNNKEASKLWDLMDESIAEGLSDFSGRMNVILKEKSDAQSQLVAMNDLFFPSDIGTDQQRFPRIIDLANSPYVTQLREAFFRTNDHYEIIFRDPSTATKVISEAFMDYVVAWYKQYLKEMGY